MSDALKLIGAVVLAAALAVGLTRWLWPTTETIQLPGSTDTVTVTQERLDTVWRERVETREVVTTDTVVLADTVWRTEVDTVAVLEPRWYLDQARIADAKGDTSYYRLTWLAGDSANLRRRESVERHVTLGPVREIQTGPDGLSVEYGEFRSCGGWNLGGLDLPGWLPVVAGGAGGFILRGQF